MQLFDVPTTAEQSLNIYINAKYRWNKMHGSKQNITTVPFGTLEYHYHSFIDERFQKD